MLRPTGADDCCGDLSRPEIRVMRPLKVLSACAYRARGNVNCDRIGGRAVVKLGIRRTILGWLTRSRIAS